MRTLLTALGSIALALAPAVALGQSADDSQPLPSNAPPVPAQTPPEPPADPPPPPADALQDGYGYAPPADAQDGDALPPLDIDQPAADTQNGQWVYTAEDGWVWAPQGDQYASTSSDPDVAPSVYVYTPAAGYCWIVAPWSYAGWWPYPHSRHDPSRVTTSTWHRSSGRRAGRALAQVSPARGERRQRR